MRTRTVVESINVSFDDGKITCIDEESHESLVFGNDIDASGAPSNTDDANPDGTNPDDVNSDEDEDAHFQGEHVHHVEPS